MIRGRARTTASSSALSGCGPSGARGGFGVTVDMPPLYLLDEAITRAMVGSAKQAQVVAWSEALKPLRTK
ncbi:hypothetical protein GCM10027259_28500 [Micromonospora palomenae]